MALTVVKIKIDAAISPSSMVIATMRFFLDSNDVNIAEMLDWPPVLFAKVDSYTILRTSVVKSTMPNAAASNGRYSRRNSSSNESSRILQVKAERAMCKLY